MFSSIDIDALQLRRKTVYDDFTGNVKQYCLCFRIVFWVIIIRYCCVNLTVRENVSVIYCCLNFSIVNYSVLSICLRVKGAGSS